MRDLWDDERPDGEQQGVARTKVASGTQGSVGMFYLQRTG